MLLYKITNKINGKIYFSVTSKRLNSAFSVLCSHAKTTERIHKLNPNYRKIKSPIQKAIVKYGRDNFILNKIKNNLTKKSAYNLKEKLIKEYNANNPDVGYNCTTGNITYKMNKDCKKRMVVANTGKKQPQSYIDFMKSRVGKLHPLFGYKHSKKTRKNMSEAQKNSNYVQTEEVRKRKSETMKRRWKEPEVIKKMANRVRPPVTKATRKKLSKANSGKNNAMYGRVGKLNPNYGRKLTPEQKKNLSDKAKIRQAKKKLELIEKYKNMTEKSCSVCKKIKSLDMFYKSSKALSGYSYQCKDCCSKRNKQRRKKGE